MFSKKYPMKNNIDYVLLYFFFHLQFWGEIVGYIFYLQVIKFPYNLGLQLLLCTYKFFSLAPQYNINLANENRFRNMTNVFSLQTLS